MYLICGLLISHNIRSLIKLYTKCLRPYNKYPNLIKYYYKKKKSYSFPSQSVINISVIYNTICNYNIINNVNTNIYFHIFYYSLLFSLAITRLYRGLHYPHDIIISYFMGDWIVNTLFYYINM